MHLPQKKLIELENVSVSYDGDDYALHNVSLSIDEGDFVAITGPNGGGKTTVLRVILQLVKPTSGKLVFRWAGKEVKKLNIGYLPQKNLIDNKFPITVEEVIASGLKSRNKIMHKITSEEKSRVEEILQLVGLIEHRSQGIGNISGGQLQRALLGRAIISRPNVLVLDEPLSYVDKKFEAHLYDIINELSKHTTMILVSHEMTRISQMANRHIIIDRTLHECQATHHFVASSCD